MKIRNCRGKLTDDDERSVRATCCCDGTGNDSAVFSIGEMLRVFQPSLAVHQLSLQPASITSSSAFKPECNGLSQYKDDTGGPSMPVREFYLIAYPPVKLSQVTPGVEVMAYNLTPRSRDGFPSASTAALG